jgi:hypothetical protein
MSTNMSFIMIASCVEKNISNARLFGNCIFCVTLNQCISRFLSLSFFTLCTFLNYFLRVFICWPSTSSRQQIKIRMWTSKRQQIKTGTSISQNKNTRHILHLHTHIEKLGCFLFLIRAWMLFFFCCHAMFWLDAPEKCPCPRKMSISERVVRSYIYIVFAV